MRKRTTPTVAAMALAVFATSLMATTPSHATGTPNTSALAGSGVDGVYTSTALNRPASTVSPTGSATTVAAAKKPRSRYHGQRMGTYSGPQDQAWSAYQRNMKAQNKQWVRKVVDAPKVGWFGAWQPDNTIAQSTRNYIESSQNGDPKKVVMMAVFRIDPWATNAQKRKPTAKEIASYKKWVINQRGAIANTPTMIVLQPDHPFIMTAKHKTAYSNLFQWTVKEYKKNKNTRVYLEAGSWDWPAPGQGGAPAAVKFLIPAGIKHADGIALNSTHYTDPKLEVKRSKEIIDLLKKKKGYRKKNYRSVINTATSGNPWIFGDWQFPQRGVADEAPACTSPKQFKKVTCVSLGIPPTFDVANKKWGLGAATNKVAAKYVDAYLWHGRPWLNMQNAPFLENKTVNLVKHSPYLKHYTW